MSDDIVDRLADLVQQATTERSHFYVAKCAQDAIAEITRLRARVAGYPPALPARAFAEGFDIHGRPLSAAADQVAAPPAASASEPVARVANVIGSGSDSVRIKWLGGFPQIGDALYRSPSVAPQDERTVPAVGYLGDPRDDDDFPAF